MYLGKTDLFMLFLSNDYSAATFTLIPTFMLLVPGHKQLIFVPAKQFLGKVQITQQFGEKNAQKLFSYSFRSQIQNVMFILYSPSP